MITINKILCPVDFFPASEAAVDYAAGLARNYEAGVRLLHVVTPIISSAYEYAVDSSAIMKAMEDDSMRELKRLAGNLKQAGVAAETELRTGDVYDEIKRDIEIVKPDLIVVGTHGRRGVQRWFMGSTTEKLLRHSPAPLITISGARENAAAAPRFRRLLVTTDFSEGTPDALAYAFSVAQENQSEIILLHVLNELPFDTSAKYRESLIHGVRKQLEELIPPDAANWCNIETRIDTGTPYRIILRMLQDEKVDLLVMNIHGKGMLDRALIGSTAERVVRAAYCPVMLIPPLKRKLKRRARPGGSHVAA